MEPYVPGVHAQHLADLVRDEFGIAPEHLVATTGLDLAALVRPGARLPLPDLERLVVRAEALTGEPLLPLRFGARMRIAVHGYLGFAVMTAATLGDALALAERYAPTLTNALSLRMEVAGEEASIVVEERGDFGAARASVVLALLIGVAHIGMLLTGELPDGRAETALAEPAGWRDDSLAERLPVLFERPRHRLVFPADRLATPIASHDPAAAEMAREQCEAALASLPEATTLRLRAEQRLRRDEGAFLAAPALARALGVSTRTLERKLRAEGTSYRRLVDEARRARAERLLGRADLSMAEVAAHVGYSDVANFTRAFRRWTGTTPGAFRREG